ncbi:MAG TPA: oxidoreductase [Prolixibacteraceae bacterium]|nr:oxidoreductase [Prolixibacteraceae bacterium]
MMEKVIKVGIIGYGLSGRYFFAPFINYHEGFQLFAVCSSQTEAISSDYPDAVIYKQPDELLGSGDVDLIIIASPNHTHYDYARKAILAGKHVVVEKPFTITSDEARELIELSEQYKVVLAPFHNRRWDGDFMTVKKIIEEGQLGEILDFESHFDRYRPMYERAPWKNEAINGNGVLYDLGPHLIDQALVLFGLPEALYANIRVQRIDGVIDDNFEIQLFYPQTKVVLKAGAIVREPGPRFSVHGRLGSFIKYGLDPQEEQLKNGLTPASEELGADSEQLYGLMHTEINGVVVRQKVETLQGKYIEYFDNVYKAISKKEPLAVNPNHALQVIQIIEKAYQSNIAKRIINL